MAGVIFLKIDRGFFWAIGLICAKNSCMLFFIFHFCTLTYSPILVAKTLKNPRSILKKNNWGINANRELISCFYCSKIDHIINALRRLSWWCQWWPGRRRTARRRPPLRPSRCPADPPPCRPSFTKSPWWIWRSFRNCSSRCWWSSMENEVKVDFPPESFRSGLRMGPDDRI